MTRVLLYTDKPVLVAGLEGVLREHGNFAPLLTVTTVPDLLVRLVQKAADVALIDATDQVTLLTVKKLKREANGCAIVLWVERVSTQIAVEMISLGVRGILDKGLPIPDQIECLKMVSTGRIWLEEPLKLAVNLGHEILTSREKELLVLLSQGMKNKEIATVLKITEGTVKVYISRLLSKCKFKDRLELARYVLQYGLVDWCPIPSDETDRPAPQ
ncbi:MAG: response regulator transcription factor [Patescibacteria group bacterium]|nr:response regulator transcription factor [Patescibacteria group bacterium]